MTHYNYNSDFKIVEPLNDAAPFRFTYYAKRGKEVVAEFDGTEYKNCIARDGKLTVPIEHGAVGLGEVKVKREYFLTDSDFTDGVCDFVTDNVPTGIEVWHGPTDAPEVVPVDVAPYYTKGDKGDKMTYEDLTEEDKEDLAGHFKMDVVNNLEDGGEDKALSAEMGKRLNEMISGISLEGGGETKLSGKLNLTSMDEIKSAQMALSKTNEIVFYLIADSTGKIPSTQSCYNIPSEAVRQLSLTSPDVTTNIVLNLLSINMQPIGVNVGDFIALTRVKVKVSDLAASIGVSIDLGGEIEIYQYKILSMNDAKPAGHSEANAGVMGLMSPWDKGQVNKINGIESTANDTRNRLNSVVNNDLFKTKYGYNNLADTCLKTGVNNYFSDRIGGITANWSLFVICSSNGDPNYYHLLQTAVCRDDDKLGRIFQRMGWYKGNGEDLHFTVWKEVGADLSVYATNDDVSIAIQSAITNTLNIEV